MEKPPVKRALIIGVGAYEHAAKLATPPFDADMVADVLKKLDPNFVITHPPTVEMTRLGVIGAVKSFASSLQPGDIAFVFFSGHGLERYSVNYLVPIDANVSTPGHEGLTYVSLPWILEQIEKSNAGISVVVLDACRVDPFAGAQNSDELDLTGLQEAPVVATEAGSGASESSVATATANAPTAASENSASATAARALIASTTLVVAASSSNPPAVASPAPASETIGLSEMNTPQGFIVAFAAEPGKPSYSLFHGELPDKGSIFTRRFVALVSTVNKPIGSVFGAIGGDVYTLTQTKQRPFVNSFDAGEVLFMNNMNLETDERETWIRTVGDSAPSDQLAGLRLFLNLYPAGPYSAAARARIGELEHALSGTANVVPTPSPVAAGPTVPQTPILLSGSLKTPTIRQASSSIAVADHDIFLRAAPKPTTATILGTIKKGEEVRVLEALVRPGWSKVLIPDGTIGYVGSVINHEASSVPDPLSVNIVGDQVPVVATGPSGDRWKSAFRQPSTIIHIDVGPTSDKNAFKARQQTFLRGLRIRAALIAQGADVGRITMTLGSRSVAVDTAIVSVSARTAP